MRNLLGILVTTALGSALGLYLARNTTFQTYQLARFVTLERTTRGAAIIAMLVSLLTGTSVGLLARGVANRIRATNATVELAVSLVSVALAEGISSILASPFVRNACFDIDYRDAQQGWLVVLLPIAMVSATLAGVWTRLPKETAT